MSEQSLSRQQPREEEEEEEEGRHGLGNSVLFFFFDTKATFFNSVLFFVTYCARVQGRPANAEPGYWQIFRAFFFFFFRFGFA